MAIRSNGANDILANLPSDKTGVRLVTIIVIDIVGYRCIQNQDSITSAASENTLIAALKTSIYPHSLNINYPFLFAFLVAPLRDPPYSL